MRQRNGASKRGRDLGLAARTHAAWRARYRGTKAAVSTSSTTPRRRSAFVTPRGVGSREPRRCSVRPPRLRRGVGQSSPCWPASAPPGPVPSRLGPWQEGLVRGLLVRQQLRAGLRHLRPRPWPGLRAQPANVPLYLRGPQPPVDPRLPPARRHLPRDQWLRLTPSRGQVRRLPPPADHSPPREHAVHLRLRRADLWQELHPSV